MHQCCILDSPGNIVLRLSPDGTEVGPAGFFTTSLDLLALSLSFEGPEEGPEEDLLDTFAFATSQSPPVLCRWLNLDAPELDPFGTFAT
jgi:hypothetical protein